MCITVQISKSGKFTDVQISERGKQRVNYSYRYSLKLKVMPKAYDRVMERQAVASWSMINFMI